MLSVALPDLRSVLPSYMAAGVDDLAARCALQLLDRRGPVRVRKTGRLLEHDALCAMLDAWLAEQCRGLTIQSPAVKFFTREMTILGEPVDDAAEGTIVAHVGNPNWDVWPWPWYLSPRYYELERMAAGLGRAAVSALGFSRCGFPVYTPEITHYHASYIYGWDDDEADDRGEAVLTEAELERAIPRDVLHPWSQPSRRKLEAVRGREAREVAHAILEVMAKAKREQRRPGTVETSSYDERHDCECVAWAAVVRWHRDDPAPRVFDDYGQIMSQSGYHESFFVSHFPVAQLGDWMTEIEHRFEVAHAIDRLIRLVAVKGTRR